MYTNLIAKMEEKKISKRDIQKLLDIHYNSVSNKFSHKTCFTIDEAIKIQEHFFPIQTRPNKESLLKQELQEAGIKAYLPEEQLSIHRHGKWHTINRYIFSGYIFIETSVYSGFYHKIRKMSGFIRFLGLPTPLPADEENQIRWLCNEGKPITASHYIKNEWGISFVDGILSETNFRIIEICPRQRRIKVSVSINGSEFIVFLPAEKI